MTENDETILTHSDEKEPLLYEVGYHLLSTTPEERVPEESGNIKDAIEALGGVLVSDGMPKLISLAYKMPKVVANKRKYFDAAFFGWIKFHMEPKAALTLRENLHKNDNILRFLLIKTEKEAVVPSKKLAFLSSARDGEAAPAKAVSTEKKGERLSEEELDKTIEELVTQ